MGLPAFAPAIKLAQKRGPPSKEALPPTPERPPTLPQKAASLAGSERTALETGAPSEASEARVAIVLPQWQSLPPVLEVFYSTFHDSDTGSTSIPPTETALRLGPGS